jgi:hypothetical protein
VRATDIPNMRGPGDYDRILSGGANRVEGPLMLVEDLSDQESEAIAHFSDP